MTATHLTDAMLTDTRLRLDGARVVAGLANGEIRRTRWERIDVLMCRMRTHKRAGRERAAMACRRMVERLLDEMEAYE